MEKIFKELCTELFKELNSRGHEQVVFFNDPYSGLKGIVAIHNTTLGPAL